MNDSPGPSVLTAALQFDLTFQAFNHDGSSYAVKIIFGLEPGHVIERSLRMSQVPMRLPGRKIREQMIHLVHANVGAKNRVQHGAFIHVLIGISEYC
jgi:hypothetical protein